MGILHSTCFGCKTEDERPIYPYLKSRLQNRPNRGGHSSSTYYVSCKEPTSSSTGKHALEERTRMKKTDREEEKKKSCKEVTSSSTGKDSPIKTSREMRWIKHYSNRHRILLVGEGDFSFSASLAVAFASAPNIIATSLNSQEFLKKNYSRAASNIDKLRRRESKVMHEVDATKMANHPSLGQVKFDRIVFNFPYAGFANTIKTLPPESQLRSHRRLVDLFLKNAREMISENGEIHISHKTMEFKLETIASSYGLRLIEAVQFNYLDYPGYRTKCGFGGDDDNFNCNPCKTCKFGLKKVHYY